MDLLPLLLIVVQVFEAFMLLHAGVTLTHQENLEALPQGPPQSSFSHADYSEGTEARLLPCLDEEFQCKSPSQ